MAAERQGDTMLPFRFPIRLPTLLVAITTILPIADRVAAAQGTVAQFYKGKTFTVVSGSAPGGGYDTYARLLARYLGRHLPGNPTVVPRNMPGASSYLAANYIFSIAPK